VTDERFAEIRHGASGKVAALPRLTQQQQIRELIDEVERLRALLAGDVLFEVPTCRVCGCTDDDCTQCIGRTGHPCRWVEADLCSACAAFRYDVDIVEAGSHTDEHGVTRGAVILWGRVEDLAELQFGTAVLEVPHG
jgi:hypothetical protein